MSKTLRFDGPEDGPVLILAHGAGADSGSDFMQSMAEMLAQHGVRVGRFDFPYMLKRQQDGKKRPPDRANILLQAYLDQVQQLNQPCVVGGKSMGGRIASMLAQADDSDPLIRACVCLGYPFHPAGKPERLRTEHLQSLRVPQLIVQGERDAMGSFEEVSHYALDKQLQLQWLADGNHDLKPRKASGHSHEQHLQQAALWVAEFVKRQLR
jgi:predicted alpha/beta-hydrolase family hydrolase